jgi:hypothetical protein
MLTFLLFKKVGLLYGSLGAGAKACRSCIKIFTPKPEPHQNDAAPQHWFFVNLSILNIRSRL